MAAEGHNRSHVRCFTGVLSLLLAFTCTAQTPSHSTFFSTATEESYSTYQLPADGDLWPSCWSNDDNLYAANGDGSAFTGASHRYDMAVSAISGMPPNLSGRTVATSVGTNWSGSSYNRKPTGMLCRNGSIYLAFQNLNSSNFNDAPAASIAQSPDHGLTWIWDTTAPLFGSPNSPTSTIAYKFTTIFFLDYGKDSAQAIDGYVYAYGMDNNWREQQSLYLARVPDVSVLTRAAWQFYAGADNSGNPLWTSDITQKAAVLTDTRGLYPVMFKNDCPSSDSVISQGGVTYDAPLQRYIFASWSCATHELYEAPRPWGPWNHFLSNDFGPLRLPNNRGQYGTSMPSKFIGSDGKTLYLQSNVCCGGDSYTFSLRKLFLETYTASSPSNPPSSTNLGSAPGTRAISKSTHFGSLCATNCADQLSSGSLSHSEDDFDEESKPTDWWGYVWPQSYNMNQVVFQTGTTFPDGGWYTSNLRVQVRQNFVWNDIAGISVTPAYPYNNQAGSSTYTFNFPETSGDGVRITGTPGGSSYFTSITQLAVYDNLANAPDYSITLSAPTVTATGSQGASLTLTLAPTNGFNQQVSFACSGLPTLSQCTFSPAALTPDGTSKPSLVTISVAANVTATNRLQRPLQPQILYSFVLLGLGMVVGIPAWRDRRTFARTPPRVLSVILIAASTLILLACGSSSGGSTSQGTPKGAYSIIVSASAGVETQRASFTLVVQ